MIRKLLFVAALLLSPITALAQGPPADCSVYGFCAGLGVPTSACKPGQIYTQIDSPGTVFACNGIPPAWHLVGSGAIVNPPAYSIQFANPSVDGLSSDSTFTFDPTHKRVTGPQLLVNNGIESPGEGIFSDLSTNHNGGVLSPTTGDAGTSLQQTLIDAALWSQAHGNARARVVVSSMVPIPTTQKIYIPSNVDAVCSAYAPRTWTGGCLIQNTNTPVNTMTGGNPLVLADFTFGVLADGKTVCFTGTSGCNVLGSGNNSLRGFTLQGTGQGGNDIGLRVASSGFSASDIAATGAFGGPFVLHVANGVNDAYEWLYDTNVDEYWCANPLNITAANLTTVFGTTHDGDLGAIDLNMVDGRIENAQSSTGCLFSKDFRSGAEYPHLATLKVDGGGDYIAKNLLQVDGIGLILDGEEHRVDANRTEYQSRETIRDNSLNSVITNTQAISGCLDPNLALIWQGQSAPAYPANTTLDPGYIVKDSNGNAEYMTYGNGSGGTGETGSSAPTWNVTVGGTTSEVHIVWQNIGPYSALAASNPQCEGIVLTSQGTSLSNNKVSQETAVDGPSYYHASYLAPTPGAVFGNTPDTDAADQYGNGVAWVSGEPFGEGGPAGLPTNGLEHDITKNSSGCDWVGDYLVTRLDDSTPQGYSCFLGMSTAPFYIVSTAAANVIYPQNVGVFGHPPLTTCDGYPFATVIGKYYAFAYDLASLTIRPANCANPNTTYVSANFLGKTAPGNQAQGVLSGFGNVWLGALPALAAPTVTGQSGSATNTYTYRIEEFAGGGDLTSTGDTTVVCGAALASCHLAIAGVLDSGCTEYKVYREATTDGSGTGLIYDGACTPAADTGQSPTSGTIPANSINTSGRLTLPQQAPSGTSSTQFGYASSVFLGTDGCLYVFTANNTSKKICGVTY